jgi:hypothetical protein
MYQCDRCGKDWEKRTFFFRHLKRKFDCKPVISTLSLRDIRKKYGILEKPSIKCKSNVSICKYCTNVGCKMCKSKSKYFVSIEDNSKNYQDSHKNLDSTLTHPKKRTCEKEKNQENDEKNNKLEDNLFICNICNKEYRHRQSLYNHQIKGCQQTHVSINNSWESERVELYSKINLLLENISKQQPTIIENQTIQNQTIQNIKNSTTINQTNIIINGFGTENMEYITDKIKTHLLKTPGVMIQKLIKFKHFNEEHPENCNIKLSLKDEEEIVETYSELNGWETKDKKILIDNIVETNFCLLDHYYEKTNGDGLDSQQKERFILFSDNFTEPNIKETITGDTEMILNTCSKTI